MRLLTRSDFDGLVCAALLYEVNVINDIKFVHPKDIQDGIIEVGENDVLANIPYAKGCGLWFDHHSSEAERHKMMDEFHFKGASEHKPSCARVIYDYYGGDKFHYFDESGLMKAVDDCDSGQFTMEDILNPQGWVLINFIMDPRTGLARYRDYRIPNYQLMLDLIQYVRNHHIEDVLELPDVKERVERYFAQEAEYEQMLKENSVADGNVLVIDLHDVEEIKTGNRFKEYVLFPDQNISIRIIWGFKKQNMVMTCGHSVFNRTSKTDVGSLMLKYGGGGHKAVGTCQVATENWEKARDELIATMKADG
ncbi:MAG: exopolyphosphatase [Nitrospinae bacterium]|nr:exopolyphosphatase [Nitrospinota bacterium]